MKLSSSFLALSVVMTATALARAQPPATQPSTTQPTTTSTQGEAPSFVQQRLPAPKNAFEMAVGTGYTQGFGSLKSGVGLPSVVTPGIGIDLQLGWRAHENWALLWSGEFQDFTAERSSSARGITTSVVMQYHIMPMKRLDPWVEAGVGYRVLWEEPSIGPTLTTHGLQVARVRVGLDFRTAADVSLGPMVGADATVFLFQDVPNLGTNINNPRYSTFIFAGVQGRFDVGGSTSSPSARVSKQ